MKPLTSTAADRLDLIESRFALRVAARLSEASETLGADVGERLRFARERALERARERVLAAAPAESASTVAGRPGGSAALGGPPGRWIKFAALVPLAALIAGLLLINEWNQRQQVDAAAEIDAAILADDLPPRAYSDPGFVEFLKKPRDRE